MLKFLLQKIKQLFDDKIIVPKSLSIYGVYTGQNIIFAAIVAFYCKHYYLVALAIGLYITTMLHWYHFSKGAIMYLDILLGSIVTIMVTFYYSKYYFKPYYEYLWYIIVTICVTIFLINEYVFYMYISKYNHFNTPFSQMMSTGVHLIFMHIMLPFTYVYCSLMSL